MDPFTAIALGSLLLGVGSKVAGAVSQKKAADKTNAANEAAAKLAQREASKDISLLQLQQGMAVTHTIFEADRNARGTQALARVSAGEAGVAGVSVEALLGDIDRKRGELKSTTGRNLDMAIAALQREKVSGRTVAQARIAASHVEGPSALAVGIGIAGEGLQFWAGQISRQPKSS